MALTDEVQGNQTMLRHTKALHLIALALVIAFVAPAEEISSIPTATAMARIKEKVAPQYPVAARQLNVTGSQEIEIIVGTSGAVEDAKVLKGNAMFSMSSIAAIKQWKFDPLVRDGAPVKFTTTVTINYSK
jgi:protein TonB